MTTYTDIAARIGDIVERKNAAYGDSFAKAGPFLRLLYPDGLRPGQFDDALAIVRIFDKLQRIAAGGDHFGESPYDDIAGYGILGIAMREQRGNQQKSAAMRRQNDESEQACTNGNASDPDAPQQPQATPASADRRTSGKTTTCASRPTGNASAPPSKNAPPSCFAPPSAGPSGSPLRPWLSENEAERRRDEARTIFLLHFRNTAKEHNP